MGLEHAYETLNCFFLRLLSTQTEIAVIVHSEISETSVTVHSTLFLIRTTHERHLRRSLTQMRDFGDKISHFGDSALLTSTFALESVTPHSHPNNFIRPIGLTLKIRTTSPVVTLCVMSLKGFTLVFNTSPKTTSCSHEPCIAPFHFWLHGLWCCGAGGC
jgi:hypothetical protein